MSYRAKVFWVSFGLIIIAITLVIGVIMSIQTANKDFLFPVMAFISFFILVFICDGCKKSLWQKEVLEEIREEEAEKEKKQDNEK